VRRKRGGEKGGEGSGMHGEGDGEGREVVFNQGLCYYPFPPNSCLLFQAPKL
jgi:hypothetical protein